MTTNFEHNPELAAMYAAYLALTPLGPAGRSRALCWLVEILDVDVPVGPSVLAGLGDGRCEQRGAAFPACV
ncbi:hypothetical protein AB0C65_38315 [Nocardia sp. NPDC048505]|uniref:hypothetical protein n=1 Tax=Nocardia sp. NPDC048505 TaxID=3155756 RepID=UPI0033F424E1